MTQGPTLADTPHREHGRSSGEQRITVATAALRPTGETASRAPRGPGLLLLLTAVVSSLLGLWQLVPPRAIPAEFASGRAVVHVQAMARAPHPMGSAENDRVRDYLVAQLRELGLEPEVQQASAVTPGTFPHVAGRVHNVLARLPGSGGTGRAVLLAAHYDSVPTGPGASDDVAGVAALLETLRALRSSPPPCATT